MDYIHRIPFITGIFATIFVGILSYGGDHELKTICTKMFFSMVVFFTIGVYLRSFVRKIDNEIRQRKEQENFKRQQEMLMEKKKEKDEKRGINIDLRAGQKDAKGNRDESYNDLYDEEFEPLRVSSVEIREEKDIM
ncbi:MAG: hypothetical protein GX992_01685 [Clostridium sp.]|nr:hypothetical protein [Clostridium sp.]